MGRPVVLCGWLRRATLGALVLAVGWHLQGCATGAQGGTDCKHPVVRTLPSLCGLRQEGALHFLLAKGHASLQPFTDLRTEEQLESDPELHGIVIGQRPAPQDLNLDCDITIIVGVPAGQSKAAKPASLDGPDASKP